MKLKNNEIICKQNELIYEFLVLQSLLFTDIIEINLFYTLKH